METSKRNIFIIPIVFVALLLLPRLTPNAYIMRVINMICIYTILGTGVNILTGYTGQLSLGQAAFYAIGAYTSALLSVKLGLPLYLTLPVAIIVTALFGLILAIPALKLKGGYLTLLTIGFGEVVRMILVNWLKLTRGPNGITNIPVPNIFGYRLSSLYDYYYFILFFVVLALLYQKMVVTSRPGRAFRAIKEDDTVAELTGINIVRYKIIAFVTSAIYSAIAGFLYAHMVTYISPDTFTANESNNILWIAIIGGMGTQWGPVLGALVMVILPEALRGLGSMRLVIYGLLLLFVIIYYPGGLGPYVGRLITKIKSKISASKSTTDKG